MSADSKLDRSLQNKVFDKAYQCCSQRQGRIVVFTRFSTHEHSQSIQRMKPLDRTIKMQSTWKKLESTHQIASKQTEDQSTNSIDWVVKPFEGSLPQATVRRLQIMWLTKGSQQCSSCQEKQKITILGITMIVVLARWEAETDAVYTEILATFEEKTKKIKHGSDHWWYVNGRSQGERELSMTNSMSLEVK